MMEINTKQELYNYLDNFDFNSIRDTELSSVYFLIESDNCIEPIYFTHYEDVWFESPCLLYGFSLKDNELINYINEMYDEYSIDLYEYEKIFQKDNWHYEIDCPQCTPFLPEKIKVIKSMSESECLDWLIENYK